MNVYLVRTKDARLYTEPVGDYGGPQFEYWPHGVFASSTMGQAKSMALRSWAGDIYSGVYSDDYVNLRVRFLGTDEDAEAGELEHTSRWWNEAAALLTDSV